MAPPSLNPSTLLQGIAATTLKAILPNLQAIDVSIKNINANPTFINAQLQFNNIAAQAIAIEADVPALLPIIAGQAIAAVSGQADDSLEQLITWIQNYGTSGSGSASGSAAAK